MRNTGHPIPRGGLRRRPLTHGLVLVTISLAAGYSVMTGGLPGNVRVFASPVTGLTLPGATSSAPASDASVLRPLTINKTLRADSARVNDAGPLSRIGSLVAAAAAGEEDAVMRAAMQAPSSDQALFQPYTIKPGDTVSGIAEREKINPGYITASNIETISNPDELVVGVGIRVPTADGVLHDVKYGETLSDIAAEYDVDVARIASFGPNKIASPNDIVQNETVLVPGARLKPVEVPKAEPTATEPPAPTSTRVPAPAPTDAPPSPPPTEQPPAPAPAPVTRPRSGSGLIWPVYGPISSYYGPSHPLGIDIDGYKLAGAPIGASTSGTVQFAGGNTCCSYGLYVVLMSPGGIQTLYAHLSSINVYAGQYVSQGETLGIIGSTGYSTGRHLHFEVIDNGVRVNPLNYLP